MSTKKVTKPKRDSVKSLREKITIMESKLQEYSEKIEQQSDKNIRLLAEFDNYKRRTQEERSKLFKYAGEDLAKSLLPILDDLHRTVELDKKGEATSILKGVELILTKLDKTLEDQGIVPFDSIGQDFDPELHEALMSENSDKGDNIVLKEFETSTFLFVD